MRGTHIGNLLTNWKLSKRGKKAGNPKLIKKRGEKAGNPKLIKKRGIKSWSQKENGKESRNLVNGIGKVIKSIRIRGKGKIEEIGKEKGNSPKR